jgi:hypothetical protein
MLYKVEGESSAAVDPNFAVPVEYGGTAPGVEDQHGERWAQSQYGATGGQSVQLSTSTVDLIILIDEYSVALLYDFTRSYRSKPDHTSATLPLAHPHLSMYRLQSLQGLKLRRTCHELDQAMGFEGQR